MVIANTTDYISPDFYATGLQKSPPDDRDYLVADVVDLLRRQLPKTGMPREYLGAVPFAVRDQKGVNSCVGFGLATAREFHAQRLQKLTYRLSPQFIYDRRIDFPTEGMYLRDGLITLLNRGVCPEASCPAVQQGDALMCSPRSLTADADAAAFRIMSFYRVGTADECKLALLTLGPVVVAIDYAFFYPGIRGLHCVVVEGYGVDDATGLEFFAFRNSWGPSWGALGYGGFAAEAWQRLVVEAWVIIPEVPAVKTIPSGGDAGGGGAPQPVPNYYFPTPQQPEPQPEPQPEEQGDDLPQTVIRDGVLSQSSFGGGANKRTSRRTDWGHVVALVVLNVLLLAAVAAVVFAAVKALYGVVVG